jgi:hypothetical protein
MSRTGLPGSLIVPPVGCARMAPSIGVGYTSASAARILARQGVTPVEDSLVGRHQGRIVDERSRSDESVCRVVREPVQIQSADTATFALGQCLSIKARVFVPKRRSSVSNQISTWVSRRIT